MEAPTFHGFWLPVPFQRSLLQRCLIVGYALFAMALIFRPTVRDPRRLIALTGAVFIATQFCKTMGPGYLDWYYHLAFMSIFWASLRRGTEAAMTVPSARHGKTKWL